MLIPIGTANQNSAISLTSRDRAGNLFGDIRIITAGCSRTGTDFGHLMTVPTKKPVQIDPNLNTMMIAAKHDFHKKLSLY